MVAALVVLLLVRHRGTTPEQFAAFTARLQTVSAPAGEFTTFDPTTSGSYGTVPEGSWQQSGAGTWVSTVDPSWWQAVHGWETNATDAQATTTCEAALAWLSTSGKTLELPAPAQGEDLATCLSVFRSVSGAGAGVNVSDAWGGRGMQTADGAPRYRTGVLMNSGPKAGQVVVQVVADATVANP